MTHHKDVSVRQEMKSWKLFHVCLFHYNILFPLFISLLWTPQISMNFLPMLLWRCKNKSHYIPWYIMFHFLKKNAAKFTVTSLNGLGRIRTNTDVSICESHFRFPFQSVKKNGHSQGMSHLILASTTSTTGQTNHDLKAPMPLPQLLSVSTG